MDAVAEKTSPSTNAARIEELGRIILAYSEVTDKLQASHDQLQRTVESLLGELADKNKQLERKNRLAALGEMAAGMAHEIRNPLGGIQLYASMLAQDVQEKPETLALVRKIAAGVKRLEGLVSQVLQFTREMSAHCVESDVAEVIGQSIELAQQALTSRGVRCDADGPGELLAEIDPLLVGQAVLNLVLNAAEAMDAGGVVTVRWFGPGGSSSDEPAVRRLRLVVRDTGPGIPPAAMDKLFNPFFTTKDTGTGLGLAIVHRIVEAHDGTITVSNSPQGGACFEIRM